MPDLEDWSLKRSKEFSRQGTVVTRPDAAGWDGRGSRGRWPAGRGARGSCVRWAAGRSGRESSSRWRAVRGGRGTRGPPSGWDERAKL